MFALFVESRIQKIKITSHMTISILATIQPFDYEEGEKSKKWETKAEACGSRLLLNIE